MQRYYRIYAVVILTMVVSVAGCTKDPNVNEKSLDISIGSNYKSGTLSEPVRFVTEHEVTISGNRISYHVVAGETFLYNLQGEPIASMFSYSYLRNGVDNKSRPVVFVFNGGPGSSSVWLHMGILGPRKVILSNDVNPKVTAPFDIQDNENCIIDVADLVFIDPVGTGYSQIIGVGKKEDFYGVDEDADSIAQFIERWLTKNNRWNSPKYIVGESYGTVRAALLPNALMGGPMMSSGVFRGISINGIIFLGTTLDLDNTDNELKQALALPSIASTAWYHNKTQYQSMAIDELYTEVVNFAKQKYYPALQQEIAGTLVFAQRSDIAKSLSAYTGIPESKFEDSITLSASEFSRLLLATENTDVGLYDGRYTLPSAGNGYEPVADDAAMGQYTPAFVATFHQMQYEGLKVAMCRPYNIIVWKDLNFNWSYNRKGRISSQGFAYELAMAMRRNADLKIFVASGYYDLVTTAAAAENSIIMAAVPGDRVFFKNYESGHMLYIGSTASQFAENVRKFITTGSI